MVLLLRYFALFFLLLMHDLPAFADEEAGFALKAVRTERSRLESGRCTCSGKRVFVDQQSPETGFDCLFSAAIAFSGDRYRIDAVCHEWVIDPLTIVRTESTSGNASAKSIRGMCRKSFAIDGTHSAFWLSYQPTMEFAGAKDAFVPAVIRSVCLDPRCPTVFGNGNWNEGLTWSQAFSKFESTGSAPPRWDVVSKADGIWTLAITAMDANQVEYEWKLLIDVDHGFVPTEYSVRAKTPAQNSSFQQMEVKTDWKELDGLMVPTHLSRKSFPCPFSAIDDQLIVDFHWTDVNQPIADELFTYETFPVTPGTGVQNVSSHEWAKDYPIMPLPAKLPPPSANQRVGFGGLLAFNVVLLALLFGSAWFRRSKAERRTRWAILTGVMSLALITAVAIILRQPAEKLSEIANEPVRTKAVEVCSWSPVTPAVVAGSAIDMGSVSVGGHTHREVFISNGDSVLELKECVSDCPGVQLFLPCMTIQPGERIGAMLDCNFDTGSATGDRIVSVRAVTTKDTEAFSLKIRVKLLD